MPTWGQPFRTLSLLPSVGVAVLSKFTCSFCLSAYTGLLSSVGVGFVATDAGLTGLTAGLLALGLAGVAWSTRRHRHLGPLAVMLLGAGVLLFARFDQPSPTRLLVSGAALAVVASLWNFWLERRQPSCCVQTEKPTLFREIDDGDEANC
jgi:hypothetical protein